MTSRRFQHVLHGATRVGALAALAACADRAPMQPTLDTGSPRFATAAAGVLPADLGGISTYPLYAGGGGAGVGTLVGYVDVTSTGPISSRTFSVTYRANAGYCFEEAHLAITGGDATAIPQKNGNPAPGQFPYSQDPATCASTITFTGVQPIAPLTGDSYVIAAHAVVSGVSGGYTGQTLVSGGSLAANVTGFRVGGTAGFTPQNSPVVAAWEPGSNTDPSFWDTVIAADPDGQWLLTNGADWVWRTFRTADPLNGEVVRMVSTINTTAATTGTLRITCDNGYAVYLNGTKLAGGDGATAGYGTQLSDAFATLSGLENNTNLMQANVSGDGWQSVEAYPISLNAGVNTLTIYGVNEYQQTGDGVPGFPTGPGARAAIAGPDVPNGNIDNNPSGCIFGVETASVPGTPSGGTETAWGRNSATVAGEFGGKNWATFIYYLVPRS